MPWSPEELVKVMRGEWVVPDGDAVLPDAPMFPTGFAFNCVVRKGWPSGEWDNEGDAQGWIDEETGYWCLIHRSQVTGSLNGYVAVTEGHPYYGHEGDDENLIYSDVHGGITFSSTIGFIQELKLPKDFWWIGFDGGHAGDILPAFPMEPYGTEDDYRNFAFMEEECRKLARELKDISGKNS